MALITVDHYRPPAKCVQPRGWGADSTLSMRCGIHFMRHRLIEANDSFSSSI